MMTLLYDEVFIVVDDHYYGDQIPEEFGMCQKRRSTFVIVSLCYGMQ